MDQGESMDMDDDVPIIIDLNRNGMTIGRESTGSTYFFTAEVITIEDSSPIHSPSSTTPQPPLICGNSENENSTNSLQFCREQVSSTSGFPCRRCHGVFYCSIAHRDMQAENHRAFCKTQSCLEVMNADPQYTMWLKHAASNLYDVCTNFVLVWPSLTAQWLPELVELDDNVIRHQLLIGTQTLGEMNHLLICGIDMPSRLDSENNESTLLQKHAGSLYVTQRINHEGEVHRARCMPQKSSIVATKSPSTDVFLFNCATFSDIPENAEFNPSLRLRGHKKDGFGLAWNPNIEGRLCSGSADGLVCLWDVESAPQLDDSNGHRYINPLMTLEKHTNVVEDVAWHHESNNLLTSVGDDKTMILWDIRLNGNRECVHVGENAHDGDINAVAWSCFSDYCFATGSSDRVVAIWDMRRLKHKLHTLEFHKDDVMQIQWSPHNPLSLASTGKDGRVFLWDLAAAQKDKKPTERRPVNINEDVDESDLSEGPVELQFIHGGHVAAVNDISWNHHETGMIASVSEDNILQVWKIDDLLRVRECLEKDDDEKANAQGEAFEDI